MRRATLPSGSGTSSSPGSEEIRCHAAKALLSDIIVNRDLPPTVRRALKKVSELINPENESRSSSSEWLNVPPAPACTLPHCGGQLSANDEELLADSIFDWPTMNNVLGLPQISEESPKTTQMTTTSSSVVRESTEPTRDGVDRNEAHYLSSKSLSPNDLTTPSGANRKTAAHHPMSTRVKTIKTISGNVYDTDEIDNNRLLATIGSWRFPILTFSQRNYKTILSQVAYKAFSRTNLLNTFHIDLEKFFNFFDAVGNGYRDLPYHNRVHASDVLHACYYLTTRWLPAFVNATNGLLSILPPLDLMALYTAAAIHDHDHPGRNNAFLVATRDPMAIIYNDRSVLENHHVSSAWKLIMLKENCFIENLTSSEQKHFRHYVIDTVLSTDLKYHYDLLMNFSDRIGRRPLEMSNEGDSLALGRMVLKLADVNSATKPAPVHHFWTQKILEEFFDQGDAERRLGLPVSSFMDRNSCHVAELQRSFMNHVVSPLLNALYQAELLPIDRKEGKCELVENFSNNLRHWHKLVEENGSKPDSDPPSADLNAANDEKENKPRSSS